MLEIVTLLITLIGVHMAILAGYCLGQTGVEDGLSQSDQETEFQIRELHISKINVKGAKKVKQKEIKKVMTSRAPSVKAIFKPKPVFKEETLKEDIEHIKMLYWTKGFYSVQISYSLEEIEDNLVNIQILIDEGELTVVKDIEFLMDEEEIESFEVNFRQLVPIKVEEAFVLEKYEKSKEVIYQFLANRGYPIASVEGEAKVDREKKAAYLSFQVTAGTKAYFDQISVQGTQSVTENIILRELSFERGQLFSLSKIQESQKKLYNTRLFKTAIISYEREVHAGDQININIKVTERKMRSFKIGAGYGTDDKLRGLIGWTHRNFGGAGGEFQIIGRASSLVRQLEVSFRQPYFPDMKSQLLIASLLEQETKPSFILDKFTNKVRLSRKLTDHSDGFLGYNLDFNKLKEVAPLTAVTLENVPEDITLNSYISVGMSHDNSNDLFYPTRGNAESLVMELSSRYLGSQENYLKVKADVKAYYRLVDDVVLAARLTLGFINPFDAANDIPIFVRFFSGGSNSIRGYPFQLLGPLDPQQKPIGGTSLLESSLELRFPIWKQLRGVVFADAGTLSQGIFDYPIDELKYSVGIGLRYQTLIGPIRLDIGYPLNPDIPLDRFRIHVSIGQAF